MVIKKVKNYAEKLEVILTIIFARVDLLSKLLSKLKTTFQKSIMALLSKELDPTFK